MGKEKIYIGIDPGTHTGFAVWQKSARRFLNISTIMIHQAIFKIISLKEESGGIYDIELIIEDARHRGGTIEKAQGAGSVKRDCSIWEDFCTDQKINFRFVRPGKNKKITKEYFKQVTGWENQTSQHSRDAAMLVYQM